MAMPYKRLAFFESTSFLNFPYQEFLCLTVCVCLESVVVWNGDRQFVYGVSLSEIGRMCVIVDQFNFVTTY